MAYRFVPQALLVGLTASVLTACAQPSVAPTPSAAGTATAPVASAAYAPRFGLQYLTDTSGMATLLRCQATLAPMVPLGYPSLDEQGRLFVPMLATYSGRTNGQIDGTLVGTDHVKAYLNPDYSLKAGDFDIVDVVTDNDGERIVARATGSGVVLKNGRVPFDQTYTVVQTADGFVTSARYQRYIGRRIEATGTVSADLTTVRMTLYY